MRLARVVLAGGKKVPFHMLSATEQIARFKTLINRRPSGAGDAVLPIVLLETIRLGPRGLIGWALASCAHHLKARNNHF